MNWPICLTQWLHMIAIWTLFSRTVSAFDIFMLGLKIQILAGTVVKQQLSFLEDICCYIVCQIKEGMLVWFKSHQHWFNVVTCMLDENWFDVNTEVVRSLEFCEVCLWFKTIQNTILRWTSGDCDNCEHGICYLNYINLWIIIIGTIT